MAILFMLAESAAEAVAHEEAGAHPPGLPQLATETFAGQLFWLALTFIALFLLLTYVVIPRIRGVLEARQSKVAGDLAAAAMAKAEADAALKAYEKAVADARAHGRTLADETRNKVKAETEARRAEAETKLNADIASAEATIAATKADALSNVRTVAAETAADIVTRLSGEAVAPGEAASAVDAALAR